MLAAAKTHAEAASFGKAVAHAERADRVAGEAAPALRKAARDLLKTASDDEIKREPVYQLTLRELAIALYKDKQFDEAKTLYQRALQADPEQTASLNNLAYMLMTDLDDLPPELDEPGDAAAHR